MEHSSERQSGCGGDCGNCSSGGHGVHSHQMPNLQVTGGLEGWKLAGAAFGAFVVPLLLAAAGAYIAGQHIAPQNPHAGVVGVAVGLVVGVLLAAIITRLACGRSTGRSKAGKSTATAETNSPKNESVIDCNLKAENQTTKEQV